MITGTRREAAGGADDRWGMRLEDTERRRGRRRGRRIRKERRIRIRKERRIRRGKEEEDPVIVSQAPDRAAQQRQ